MTTRSPSDVRIDRSIEAWLELGPTELPRRVVDAARVEVHRTRQRRAWWMGWTLQLRPRTRLVATLGAALMLIVLLGVGLRLSSSPNVGASPSPSPTASPRLPGFHPTGSMSIGRLDHTATRLLDGRVLIAGGSGWVEDGRPAGSTEPVITASAELYDPATGKFSLTGSMTTARAHHTATLLLDGRVLLTGGGISGAESDVDPGAKGFALASAEIYDPTTGQFTATGSMSAGRLGAYAIRLADGRVLVTGGVDPSPTSAGEIRTAEIYDPTTGRFTPAGLFSGGSLASPVLLAPVLLADGRVLGLVESDPRVPALWEIYDPVAATLSSLGNALEGYYQATVLADGRVLFIGGIPQPGDGAVPQILVAQLYDPATGSIRPTGTPGIDFQAFTTTLLADGRVLLVGFTGRADSGPTPAAVIYDPVSQAFDRLPESAVPIVAGQGAPSRRTATLLLDGRVLFTGGGANVGRSRALSTAELFE
jgi:hypothetical protein